MELLVAENKNIYGEHRGMNTVRVFLQGDLNYGLWIAEDLLFSFLTDTQKKQYAEGKDYPSCHFDIDFETASKILENGKTPFNKQTLYRDS